MIKYALSCSQGHRFESWFQSAQAFEKLHQSGLINCAVCGETQVQKQLMAPNLGASADSRDDNPTAPQDPAPDRPLSAPASPAEQALAELRKQVEQNADYVGKDFATEARAMHEGDSPERAIWGEARIDEAKQLLEDGVPVAPLPFAPNRKAN